MNKKCFLVSILSGLFFVSAAFSAQLSTYATKTTPAAGDKALITDVADGSTKNALLSGLPISTAMQAALDAKAASLTADQNYVSDAQLTVIGNTSGTNTGDQTATTVPVTASGFNGNLATTDDTVQEVAQKLDDLVASGVAINDAAGNGDTAVTWSANKLFDEFALKASLTGGTFSGSISAPSFISTAADGAKFLSAVNSVAITETATTGRLAWLTDRYWLANGANWTTRYLLDSSFIGSAVQSYDADTLVDAIEFVIDGGGSAITAGVKGYLEIPYAATINRVTVLCDQSGSIVVDVWKDTYANYPPLDADSITASAPPSVTTATKGQDATLTGWTTAVSAGDIVAFNVDSATTVTKCTVSLKVAK